MLAGFASALVWLSVVALTVDVFFTAFLRPHELATPGHGVTERLYDLELAPPSGAGLVDKAAPGADLIVSNVRATISVGQTTGSPTLRWLLLLRGVEENLLLIASIIVFSQLRKLFDDALADRIFSNQSIRRITTIGWTILVYLLIHSAAISVLDYATAQHLLEHAQVTGFKTEFLPVQSGEGTSLFFHHLRINIPFTGIFWALCTFALAEAFRQGLKLREENDLTI